MVSDSLVRRLERQAAVIRRHIIEVATEHVCHIGGALSIADVMTALYFHVLKVDPANPRWPERDYFILSKGHSVLALYAALAERGFFPVETLRTFEQKGSKLAAHPTLKAPGVEVATGSLGHGLPIGMGIAVACRVEGVPNRVFVVMGDGEMQEGSVWEAALAAPRFGLDNLVAIIDDNRFQASNAVDQNHPRRAAGRQVAQLPLGHCRDRRQRHGSGGRCPGASPRGRAADGYRGPHGEGQGRTVLGEHPAGSLHTPRA